MAKGRGDQPTGQRRLLSLALACAALAMLLGVPSSQTATSAAADAVAAKKKKKKKGAPQLPGINVPPFIKFIGGPGSGDGKFEHPDPLATDAAGNLYVGDQDLYRIQKFSPAGTLIAKWGSQGSGSGQFQNLTGIAIDFAGNVYVADSGRVQKFTANGSFITKWGSTGTGNGQFRGLEDIAVDGLGNVYTVESEGATGNGRVQKFTGDGTYVSQWNSLGIGGNAGELYQPDAIAADAFGNVFVADNESNGRIVRFTSNGAFVSTWAGFIHDFRAGHLNLGLDPYGSVYLATSEELYKYTSAGVLLARWAGGKGNGPGYIISHQDIAADSKGNIYAAEGAAWSRIQKFGPVPGPPQLGKASKRNRKRKISFHFGSPDTPSATFECRLTGEQVRKKKKRWASCSSPKRYTGLQPGAKVFQVRAVDGDGTQGRPATFRWTIVE